MISGRGPTKLPGHRFGDKSTRWLFGSQRLGPRGIFSPMSPARTEGAQKMVFNSMDLVMKCDCKCNART